MPRFRFALRVPAFAIHAALALQGMFFLYAVGRPLFTDDLWWHLSLGRAFLKGGPRLAADPTLHTAPGPPDVASWLWDVLVYLLQQTLGFGGLRVFHVLAAAAILALVWLLLRRASGSRLLASLGAACFAALASYQLFQLRPGLFSLFAALALYALLQEEERPPSRKRIAWAALLTACWANLHAGFALGPILLLAACFGVASSLPLLAAARRSAAQTRLRGLFTALAACLVASLVNPQGYAAYLPYLNAGASTPELGLVFDEWAPFAPFQFPAFDTQPTPLTFALLWILFGSSVLLCAGSALSYLRNRNRESTLPWDPALLAVSAASFCAALLAVRFLWLGVFPLLLIFDTLRRRSPGRPIASSPRGRWGIAAAAWLLVFAFLRVGDWPFISRGAPTTWTGYAKPYSSGKYPLHATWFLQDAGLSGRLYNAYYQGGFLSFWLSPELRTFVDGSLNVAPGVMQAYAALQARSGVREEEGFLDLLDRYEIDVFVGIGLPSAQHPTRPWRYTAAHLEGTKGWIPIFRSARSALYLRDAPRNAENLRRVARYYRAQGVPFDAEAGFDAGRVLAEAPGWSRRNGMLPRDFGQATRQQFAADARAARDARERLSAIFGMLGLYDRVARLEARTLALDPLATSSRRRFIWALLRSGRSAEALAEAQKLGDAEGLDRLTQFVARSAREIAALEDPARRAERVAMLPVFSRSEANWHAGGYVAPELRELRPGVGPTPVPERSGDVPAP